MADIDDILSRPIPTTPEAQAPSVDVDDILSRPIPTQEAPAPSVDGVDIEDVLSRPLPTRTPSPVAESLQRLAGASTQPQPTQASATPSDSLRGLEQGTRIALTARQRIDRAGSESDRQAALEQGRAELSKVQEVDRGLAEGFEAWKKREGGLNKRTVRHGSPQDQYSAFLMEEADKLQATGDRDLLIKASDLRARAKGGTAEQLETEFAIGRGATQAYASTLSGLTFGLSNKLVQKELKLLGIDPNIITPGSTFEQVNSGIMSMVGSMLTGSVAAGGLSKRLGILADPSKRTLLTMLKLRLGTSAIMGGGNALVDLTMGEGKLKDRLSRSAGNMAQSMALAFIGFGAEHIVPSGASGEVGRKALNFAAQVIADVGTDYATDRWWRKEVKKSEFWEWFNRPENIVNTAQAVLFAGMDFTDPNFEKHRARLMKKASKDFKASVKARWIAHRESREVAPLPARDASVQDDIAVPEDVQRAIDPEEVREDVEPAVREIPQLEAGEEHTPFTLLPPKHLDRRQALNDALFQQASTREAVDAARAARKVGGRALASELRIAQPRPTDAHGNDVVDAKIAGRLAAMEDSGIPMTKLLALSDKVSHAEQLRLERKAFGSGERWGRHEERADLMAKVRTKAGDRAAIQDSIIEYAKSALRGKVPETIAKAVKSAKTEAQLAKALRRVGAAEARELERQSIRDDMAEVRAIKRQMTAERQALREGERVGRVETRKRISLEVARKKRNHAILRDDIKQYARETLTVRQAAAVARIADKATTRLQYERAIRKIDRIESEYKRQVAVTQYRKVSKKITKQTKGFKKLRPEYQGPIKQIIESIDPTDMTESTRMSLDGTAKFLEKNPDHRLPDEVLGKLQRLNKKPLSEMTLDEVDLVTNTLLHLKKLNDQKQDHIAHGHSRTMKQDAEAMSEGVTKNSDKLKRRDRTPAQAAHTRARDRAASVVKNAEYRMRDIEGENGVGGEYVVRDLHLGRSKEVRANQEYQEEVLTPIRQLIPRKELRRWSDFGLRTRPSGDRTKAKGVDYIHWKLQSGRDIEMTRMERVVMARHMMSADIKDLLHRDGGFRLAAAKSDLFKLTADDVDTFQRSLTPQEKRVATILHKYENGTQKRQISETSVAVDGYDKATVEDHVRRYIDPRDRQKLTTFRKYQQEAIGEPSSLIARTGTVKPLVIGDALVTSEQGARSIARYHGLAEPIQNAKEFLARPEVRDSIEKAGGEEAYRAMEEHILAIETDIVPIKRDMKWLATLNNRLTTVALGYNYFVKAKQYLSFASASTQIGAARLAKAAASPNRVTLNDMKQGGDWGLLLFDRYASLTFNQDVGDMAAGNDVRAFLNGKRTIAERSMNPILNADRDVVLSIATAVRDKIAETGLGGRALTEATMKETHRIVRMTQPTFDMIDRPAYLRHKEPGWKLITKFMSQRSKNLMMVADNVRAFKAGEQSLGRTMRNLTIITIIMAAGNVAIDEARKKLKGIPPKKHYATDKALSVLTSNLSTLPYYGLASSSIQSLGQLVTTGEKTHSFEPQLMLTSAVGDALDDAQGLASAVREKDAIKILDSAEDLLGQAAQLWKGIPYRTLKGYYQIGKRAIVGDSKKKRKRTLSRSR